MGPTQPVRASLGSLLLLWRSCISASVRRDEAPVGMAFANEGAAVDEMMRVDASHQIDGNRPEQH